MSYNSTPVGDTSDVFPRLRSEQCVITAMRGKFHIAENPLTVLRNEGLVEGHEFFCKAGGGLHCTREVQRG